MMGQYRHSAGPDRKPMTASQDHSSGHRHRDAVSRSPNMPGLLEHSIKLRCSAASKTSTTVESALEYFRLTQQIQEE